MWKSKAEKVQENKKAKKGLQSFITGSESFKGQFSLSEIRTSLYFQLKWVLKSIKKTVLSNLTPFKISIHR